MIKLLFRSSTSACFELTNTNPYFSPQPYYVIANGTVQEGEYKENVFSLFDLQPDTEYSVEVSCDRDIVTFRTLPETGVVDVQELGAQADGVTDDTYYIQMALDTCPKGGRVLFRSGVYYTRPLYLRANITLDLQEGAELLGSAKEEDYPYVPGKIVHEDGTEEVLASWEGDPFDCHTSFINGYKVDNIRIVGRGVINGNADKSTWWATPKGRKVARGRNFFINHCNNVVMHGVTSKNSASWNLHPYFSNHLGFYDLRIQNPYNGPNTDGLDPESCDYVDIVGCVLSVGDDCIAIKSGKFYMGMKYQTPANHHTLRNNLFQDGHGAIVLGSEMSGGVQNLTVSQCIFRHTDRGLRIKSRRGRGKYAIIDDVLFENIRMENVITPLVVNMYYFCDPDGHDEYVWSRNPMPVDDRTPYLGKFTFRDIQAVDCECMCAYFDGLVERPIKEIVIENMSFRFKKDAKAYKPAMLDFIREYRKEGLYIDNVEKVVLKNVTFDGVEGEPIINKNCGSVVIE